MRQKTLDVFVRSITKASAAGCNARRPATYAVLRLFWLAQAADPRLAIAESEACCAEAGQSNHNYPLTEHLELYFTRCEINPYTEDR